MNADLVMTSLPVMIGPGVWIVGMGLVFYMTTFPVEFLLEKGEGRIKNCRKEHECSRSEK